MLNYAIFNIVNQEKYYKLFKIEIVSTEIQFDDLVIEWNFIFQNSLLIVIY